MTTKPYRKIDRYSLSEISKDGEVWSEMRKNPQGYFAKYEDIDSANAEIERLRDKIREMKNQANELYLDDLEKWAFQVLKESKERLGEL